MVSVGCKARGVEALRHFAHVASEVGEPGDDRGRPLGVEALDLAKPPRAERRDHVVEVFDGENLETRKRHGHGGGEEFREGVVGRELSGGKIHERKDKK